MQISQSLFRVMEAYAEEYKVPIIRKAGAKVLTGLIAGCKPLAVLEIGAAIGYSALKMLENMPADGKITAIELDPERIAVARQFVAKAGAAARLELIAGDAGKIITELRGPYDFIFIDAAKGQYLDYFRKLEGKLAVGAVIAADNILFRGFVESGQAPPRRYRTIVMRLRQYLEYVNTHPAFSTTVRQDGDGIAISYYRGTTCE
ncbi:O-methyltransferase|uniref:Predicted O-methyltransferase YrrM n=1 Tax=Dendrosporobacter quercicolus TaxID=146817 RepID=A0A1G9KTX7_9FIRM|nr:O-methyltransferase [Dendrosporobacter quercicolus]NSL46505.1 O-methyltransferase [Dendrosporobacter quercicolus DSM 1736]SDL53300.1 Predicted O-methyltransferase YrrM [Dendrosporobacter quercicolus]